MGVTEDPTIYKIAMAALLHDIGKFAERARGTKKEKQGFYPSREFLNRHRDLYQPLDDNGKYTHAHALYTAAFMDKMKEHLPAEFNMDNWGLGDTFVNLAAGHHNPKTPMQWIITLADWLSSGSERNYFDKSNNINSFSYYKKTRMLTIFEEILNKNSSHYLNNYKFRYKLSQLSPDNVFPIQNLYKKPGAISSKEYKPLFDDFVKSLKEICHKDMISLWLEHFDSLFMIYASNLPAATFGSVIPVTSLYDHSRTTAAIASALYKYHKENKTFEIEAKIAVEAIKHNDEKKFLMIVGNFYGIQDFIFAEGNSTHKAAAKLLRGRSFTVSLIVELAADMLCRELGLPITSIVFNAAGKFTVLAPNTKEAKATSECVENEINCWLIKHFYGQCSIGFSYVEATPKDFLSKQYKKLKQKLSYGIERKKYSKIDLNSHGGIILGYLETFVNTPNPPLCPFCGKRPARSDTDKEYEKHPCGICRDHIFIGKNIVKKDQIAITEDAKISGDTSWVPFFDRYLLSFTPDELDEQSPKDTLLKFWDISISKEGKIDKTVTAKFINGYVPLSNVDKTSVMTFEQIAAKALNHNEVTSGKTGLEALGILKMDVDNLSNIMTDGIVEKMQSISLDATLSRQMNNYFTVFLPWKLKTCENLKDIYTVFAGGDDLFLIGPWNRIIEAAWIIRSSFRGYVCNNAQITISAGIVIAKPHEPVRFLAERADEALSESKAAGRDRITLFGEKVTWDVFGELQEVWERLDEWVKKEIINSAMLYRFNEITEMAKKATNLKDFIEINGGVHIDDMECLKWRAMLKYTVARNVGQLLKNDDERTDLINTVSELATGWFEKYGGAMKIPLWQIIYNRRTV